MKQNIPPSTDKHEVRVTRLTVLKTGKPIFDESATHIEIDDEAAGEFICVRQNDINLTNMLRFNPDEWPVLRDAIEFMVKEARET